MAKMQEINRKTNTNPATGINIRFATTDIIEAFLKADKHIKKLLKKDAITLDRLVASLSGKNLNPRFITGDKTSIPRTTLKES